MAIQIDLTNQVALVIGGGSGIGASISKLLATAGAHIAIGYCNNRDAAKKTVESISASAGMPKTLKIDVTKASSVKQAISSAEKLGMLTILVNCAGWTEPVSFENMTKEQWKRGIDINLTGVYNVVHAILPIMRRQKRGRVILIGSAVVYTGGGGIPSYAAAKAGIGPLIKSLSKEYSKEGITFNAILPALVDTPLLRIRHPNETEREKLTLRIPVGRLGKPEDVAGMVLYLVSDLAGYITGQSILVDGGST